MRAKHHLGTASLLFVAAWLRLGHLDTCELKYDEARILQEVETIASTGDVPAVGLVSSQGVHNFPLTFVLLTPFHLVNPDPVWLSGVFACMGVLAVLALFLVVRACIGTGAGVAAAGLMAVSPWAVLFSRKISNIDFIPLFSIALFAAILCACARRRSWCVLFVPVLWGLLVQLHWSALTLAPGLLLALLGSWRRLHWPALATGAVLAGAMFVPFLAHQATHGWVDLRALTSLGGGSPSRPVHELALESTRTTVEILCAGGWHYVTGESEAGFGEAYAFWRVAARLASYTVAALFAMGAASSTRRVARSLRERGEEPPPLDVVLRAVTLAWLASVLIATSVSGLRGVHPHQLLMTCPAAYSLVAMGALDLWSWLGDRKMAASVLVVAGIATLVAALGFTLAFQEAIVRHGGTEGDYGVAYRHKRDAAAFLVDHQLTLDESVATADVRVLASRLGAGASRQPLRRALLVNPMRGGSLPPGFTGTQHDFGPLLVLVPGR